MGPATDIEQVREALISRVDEQLSHVHEQIQSADEQLASMEAQLSRQRRGISRSPPRQSRNTSWLRGIVGLLLVAYIVAAALASQSSYGGVVERWAPQLVSALTLPKLVVQLAATETPARIAPNDTTPTTLSVFAEPAKSLETVTRDLAELARKIEMLNAMVTDNANAVEQIQANQEQVIRDIARNAELLKASEEQVAKLVATNSQQNLQLRTTASQPQAAISTRKPVPTPAPSHASARPQDPTQLRPQER